MSATHGKKGQVMVGANVVASIKKWKFDSDRDVHDTTSFGDVTLPERTFLPGLVGRTGSCEGDWDNSDTNGQVAMINSMTSDTPLALKLYTSDTHYWAVSAFITKSSGEVPIDDLESISFDFQITGGATFT